MLSVSSGKKHGEHSHPAKMSSIEITGPSEVHSYLCSGEEKISVDKVVVPGSRVSSSINFMRYSSVFAEFHLPIFTSVTKKRMLLKPRAEANLIRCADFH